MIPRGDIPLCCTLNQSPFVYYAEETFITRIKHLLRGDTIYYVEKTFITWMKHLLRGENIYYAQKTFITWRKHLLRGENIYYVEKTCITWRKHSLRGYTIYFPIILRCFTLPLKFCVFYNRITIKTQCHHTCHWN